MCIEIVGVSPSTLSVGACQFNKSIAYAIISLLIQAYHSPQKHQVLFGNPSDCMNHQILRLPARINLFSTWSRRHDRAQKCWQFSIPPSVATCGSWEWHPSISLKTQLIPYRSTRYRKQQTIHNSSLMRAEITSTMDDLDLVLLFLLSHRETKKKAILVHSRCQKKYPKRLDLLQRRLPQRLFSRVLLQDASQGAWKTLLNSGNDQALFILNGFFKFCELPDTYSPSAPDGSIIAIHNDPAINRGGGQ